MNAAPPAALVEAVQTNCHIADARHAQDLALCTFLLQMREFHRWERGLPLDAPLARAEVGDWIARREALWAELEGRDFVALPGSDGGGLDAFAVEPVNAVLVPQGFVYGAGWAGRQPGFFAAELVALRSLDGGLVVQWCGHEWARGLFAPPAALTGDTIVLRGEAMARWLWERFGGFARGAASGPVAALVQAYGLTGDLHGGLRRMRDEQAETLILHEVGEHRAGRRLGPAWGAMRLALADRRSELAVRAVRDQLADLATTLPVLLARGQASAIHFWFSGYDGLREQLFPGLWQGYRGWCDGDGGEALQAAAAAGLRHFSALADEVLALYAADGDAAAPRIAALLADGQAVCRP